MDDLTVLESQIRAQVIGMYTFEISYTDAQNEAFRLIDSADGYYVWPLFCKPKRTSKFKFEQICRMAEGFISGTERRHFIIDGWFTYDDFMDNYYNVSAALTLSKYINRFYDETTSGTQTRFSEKQSVSAPQVTQWLKKDMVVVGTKLYSFRRDLISPRNT